MFSRDPLIRIDLPRNPIVETSCGDMRCKFLNSLFIFERELLERSTRNPYRFNSLLKAVVLILALAVTEGAALQIVHYGIPVAIEMWLVRHYR
jgi:hypothetical protein